MSFGAGRRGVLAPPGPLLVRCATTIARHPHARQFGERIKELYGIVPGSMDFQAEQTYLQPPEQQTDIVHVIKGVIEAESGAIEHYNDIVEFCDDKDLVTQDMVIEILHDEEGHRRLFEGFLREYEAEGLA